MTFTNENSGNMSMTNNLSYRQIMLTKLGTAFKMVRFTMCLRPDWALLLQPIRAAVANYWSGWRRLQATSTACLLWLYQNTLQTRSPLQYVYGNTQ